MTEVVLPLCRETNLKVMTILNDITKKEDVTEFITTIQLVQITINSLMKSKKMFSFEALKELQAALKDYETELHNLNGTGKLLRFFASTRLRRKIEQMNSLVHIRLENLRESIKDEEEINLTGSSSNVSLHSSSSNSSLTGPSTTAASASVVSTLNNGLANTSFIGDENAEYEEEDDLLFMIEDEDGKDLWAGLFGLNTFMVSKEKFVNGIKKVIFDLKEDEIKVLLYILDTGNTGTINQHKFSEFLKGFGPVTDCVRNMKSVLSCPWFYGFINRAETDLLLRDQPAGTFLIRFSATQPGSFALAFVNIDPNSGNTITAHILIQSAKPEGFVVNEQDSTNARTFRNLYELVDFYSLFLIKALDSELPFEAWFEGDVSSNETVEALSGCPEGTFLVRFSSQLGAYAISFVNSAGSITHSLIEHEGVPDNGFRIYTGDSKPLIFKSVKEVVHFYGESLKHPLSKSSNELRVEATRSILAWKRERAEQIVEVSKTVDIIFDTTQPLPAVSNANGVNNNNVERDPRVDEIIARLFST